MAAKKAAKKATKKASKKKTKIIRFTKDKPWTGTQWKGETVVSLELMGIPPGTYTLLVYDIKDRKVHPYPIYDFGEVKFKSGARATVPLPQGPKNGSHTPGSIQAWVRTEPSVWMCGITGEAAATKDTRRFFNSVKEFMTYCDQQRPKLLKQYKSKPLKVAKHHVPSNER